MKKLLFFGFLFILSSCDDGDLQIETIDFDSVAAQTCESAVTTGSTLFFKINDKEALILTLQSGVLKNEVATDIRSTVPGQSKIVYRIFSDKLTKDYFCNAIPLTTPTVIDEVEAKAGEVLITTTTADSITYSHEISLSEISFITANDSRITDLRINDFGTVTTKVP